MSIKRWMWWFIAIFTCLVLALTITNIYIKNNYLIITFVVLITFYFMFCIKPFVGALLNLTHKNYNYENKWFKVRNSEIKIYNFLKVKRWKNILPTYNRHSFDLSSNSLESIAKNMCQAELAHEIMFLISYIPLLLMIRYKDMFIFLIIICILFSLIDLLFIMIQRFNRYRIINIINKYDNISNR